MGIVFTILYHKSVMDEDVPKLSPADKKRIRKSIEEKLMTRPDVFGKPLRRSLSGYRKLRAGDYRVVFRIENTTVVIFCIAHRSVVYKKFSNRI
ncbi:MAG: type II toxin-antitoxin system RelE/ParE family toxin [Patescibacteria group bacterium]